MGHLKSTPGRATPQVDGSTHSVGWGTVVKLFNDLWIRLAHSSWDLPFAIAVLLVELLLSLLIVQYVPYTEIDWTTYLQQVRLAWEDGIFDYMDLKGDTGPLVYPAGFLYLYGALWKLTNNGNVKLGQYIFVAIYLATQAVVLSIYTTVLRDRPSSFQQQQQQPKQQQQQPLTVWCWRFVMLLCLCGSKRIHSIFLLRLFNDGPTMLLLYVSILLCMKQHWRWACVVFSLAVSIKMNVLLFAPGLLLLLLVQPNSTLFECFLRLSICALVQLVLGLPFLLTNPISYLRKAFELDRVFQYKWTVNWKFLPENLFVSKPLSLVLLFLHVSTLIYLFCYTWLPPPPPSTRTKEDTSYTKQKEKSQQVLSPTFICYTMLVSNLIGIIFARTLHYQFYVWYFHALPLILWITILTTKLTTTTPTSTITPTNANSRWWIIHHAAIRLLLWLMVEYAFNIFPATPLSSLILQVAHGILLLGFIRPPHLLNIPTYATTGVAIGDDRHHDKQQ